TDDNKLQSQTYPSGAVIGYSYNEDQLYKISIDQETFIQNIHYDAANRITGWQWADNSEYSKSYDQNGRLKTFTLGNSQRTLEYDETGNITGWADNNSDEYKQFDYDALNRLNAYNKNLAIADINSVDEMLQSQSFSYDANGNRIQLTEDGTSSTSYQILENSNRLTAIDNNPREYDSNGNLINDGEHRYQYDARNRLISVDGITSNLYNADNQRVRKTNSDTNETTLYGWTGERIFAEYDEQGSSIQETVYLGNMPIGIIKQEIIYRVYVDQIDTPRVITDENNIIIWQWDSKPFGESLPNEDSDGNNIAFSYNLRFPGQYYDVETHKYYNFNRDYNPIIGRYIQSDPVGLNGGLNSYTYTGQSPVSLIDPRGLKTVIVSNINGGYLFGAGGQHTGLIVLRGSAESAQSFIYDPSGSFRLLNSFNARIPLGSGRFIGGSSGEAIDLADYVNFQKTDGPDVRLFEFNTSLEEEQQIQQRTNSIGGGGFTDCTTNVSSAIKGIGVFKNILVVTLPSTLASQLEELKNPSPECTGWFCF
ncbi:MAG: RHS repeat domain-containing protein, partial [Methylococcaceae bacterium]